MADQARFSELNNDVLRIVLGYACDSHKRIGLLRLVCHEWHENIDDTYWQCLVVRGWMPRNDTIACPAHKPKDETTWKEWYMQRLASHRAPVLIMQPQLTVCVRSILLSWMVGVIDECRGAFFDCKYVAALPVMDVGLIYDGDIGEMAWRQMVLSSSVVFLDRFLSCGSTVVSRADLQTVGAACVLLAMQPERDSISSDLYEWITGWCAGAFRVCDLEDMTRKIFNTLTKAGDALKRSDANAYFSANKCLDDMGKLCDSSSTFHLTCCLIELALQCETSLIFDQQIIGISSFVVACYLCGWAKIHWYPSFLEVYGEHNGFDRIYDCCSHLLGVYKLAQKRIAKLKAACAHSILKYCRKEHKRVATIVPPQKMMQKFW